MPLGAMTFGEDWSFGSGGAKSKQVLDRYLERGGNFIDTANVYIKGHSGKIIGDVRLEAEHLKALEEVSRPKLNFPYDFVRNSAGFGHGGATVNGVPRR